jgi:hypothetical protein
MIRKLLILAIAICLASCSQANETADRDMILSILKTQEQAWNNYDLEGFMDGYWKSDSLKILWRQRIDLWMGANLEKLSQKISFERSYGNAEVCN